MTVIHDETETLLRDAPAIVAAALRAGLCRKPTRQLQPEQIRSLQASKSYRRRLAERQAQRQAARQAPKP